MYWAIASSFYRNIHHKKHSCSYIIRPCPEYAGIPVITICCGESPEIFHKNVPKKLVQCLHWVTLPTLQTRRLFLEVIYTRMAHLNLYSQMLVLPSIRFVCWETQTLMAYLLERPITHTNLHVFMFSMSFHSGIIKSNPPPCIIVHHCFLLNGTYCFNLCHTKWNCMWIYNNQLSQGWPFWGSFFSHSSYK